jgi:TonB family protein
MAALLLVGQHLDAPPRTDDHRTRSRRLLRRGLLLSGALHLSLLFVFLSLTNRGDEGLVRLIDDPTYILRPPGTVLEPRPPDPATGGGAITSNESGRFEPVPEVIDPPAWPDPGLVAVDDERKPGRDRPSGDPTGGNPPPHAQPREGPYSVIEVDEPPVEIYAPKPAYPEMAREIGLTGRVLLRVLIGSEGTVRNVVVLSGPRLLSESAQEGLYRWRFRPARVMGKPVSVWVEVPVVYVL